MATAERLDAYLWVLMAWYYNIKSIIFFIVFRYERACPSLQTHQKWEKEYLCLPGWRNVCLLDTLLSNAQFVLRIWNTLDICKFLCNLISINWSKSNVWAILSHTCIIFHSDQGNVEFVATVAWETFAPDVYQRLLLPVWSYATVFLQMAAWTSRPLWSCPPGKEWRSSPQSPAASFSE